MGKIKQMPHVTVEQVLSLRDAAIKIEQERDELAAQVERLLNYVKRGSPWNTNTDKCERIKVLSETPPDALGALKAQWQADILASTSIQIVAGKPEATSIRIATALLEESKRIRQRAKEHNQ